MAALPVIPLSSTDLIQNGGQYFVEGGPAEGIYAFASTDGYPAEGGSAQPVYVVSDAEAAARGVTGGTKRLMKQVARGSRPTIGGAAKPVYVLGGAFDPTFTPASIAGLSLWLDASDPATLFQDSALTTPATADTNPVGGWKDKSGNGNNVLQATAGFRPLLKKAIQNNRDVVRFDGIDDRLKSANFTLNQPMTVFMVAKLLAAPAANSDLLTGNTNDTELFVTPGRAFSTYAGTIQSAGDLGIAAFHVLTGIFNGAPSNNYVDGTLNKAGDPGAGNTAGVSLGTFQGGATQPLNFDGGEVIIYTAALTLTQQNQVQAYLGSKWGITVATS